MQNKSIFFKLLIPIFLFCFNTGPYIVIENYGNWKTLSIASKSAYITGVWDGYMTFSGDDIIGKYNNFCGKGRIIKISDLIEAIDSLYKQKINRGFSPSILIKEKAFNLLCKS